MWQFIKDFLGIDEYYLSWDFISDSGRKMKDEAPEFPMTKIVGKNVVQKCNSKYGAKSHWLVRISDRKRIDIL